MRTDTSTFRTNVFKSVRALGINSQRSKIVARRIASGIAHGSYTRYDGKVYDGVATLDTFELKLDFCFNGSQIVDVIVDGVRVFGASTDDHVLVSTEPTATQIALKPQLEEAAGRIRDVVADACDAWNEANGNPTTNELAEKRHGEINADPKVVAVRAAYAALRDRSLDSNRFATISYVDPALHSCYSDDHKDEYGFRPRGHVRYDEVVAFYERTAREHAANDDQEIADAA
jgi:hypothetical protein